MKDVSLKEMRKSEGLLRKKSQRKDDSFVDMFNVRMALLRGKRKRISVTIDVKIKAENRDQETAKTDECNVESDKVQQKLIDFGEVYKRYGSFVVNIKEALEEKDLYNYLMYLLIEKKVYEIIK